MPRSLPLLCATVALAALCGCRTIATADFYFEPVGAVRVENRPVAILPPESNFPADRSLGRVVLVKSEVDAAGWERVLDTLGAAFSYGIRTLPPDGYSSRVKPDDMVALALARECAASGATAYFVTQPDPSIPCAIGTSIRRMDVSVAPRVFDAQRGTHGAVAVFELALTPFVYGVPGAPICCRAEVVSDLGFVPDRQSMWAGAGPERVAAYALEEAMQEVIARLMPQALHALGVAASLPQDWATTTHSPLPLAAGTGGTP